MSVRLHQLIHELSAHEKGYISAHAFSENIPPRFEHLYNALCQMEQYVRSPLVKLARTNSLSADCNRLSELIFQCMRQYRRRNSIAIQVRDLLEDVRFLYNKNLIDQARKRLAKAKELALRLDNPFALIEIKSLEHYLLVRTKSIHDVSNIYSENLKDLQATLHYTDTYFFLTHLYRSIQKPLDDEKQNSILKHLKASDFHLDNAPGSQDAQWRFMQCRGLYLFFTNQPKAAMQANRELLDWWEEHPTLLKERIHAYIRDYGNCTNLAIFTEHLDEARVLLKGFSEIETRTELQKTLVLEKKYFNQLLLHLNNKKYEEAISTVRRIKTKLLPRKLASPSIRGNIYLNAILLHFQLGNFQQVEDWVDQYLQIPSWRQSNNGIIISRRALLIALLTAMSPNFTRLFGRVHSDYRLGLHLSLSHPEFQFIESLDSLYQAIKNGGKRRPHYTRLLDCLSKLDHEPGGNPGDFNSVIRSWINTRMKLI